MSSDPVFDPSEATADPTDAPDAPGEPASGQAAGLVTAPAPRAGLPARTTPPPASDRAPLDLARRIVELAADKKAADIILLEIAPLTTVADYLVLCSGGSERQLDAIADGIAEGSQGRGDAHPRPRGRGALPLGPPRRGCGRGPRLRASGARVLCARAPLGGGEDDPAGAVARSGDGVGDDRRRANGTSGPSPASPAGTDNRPWRPGGSAPSRGLVDSRWRACAIVAPNARAASSSRGSTPRSGPRTDPSASASRSRVASARSASSCTSIPS